MRTVVVLYLVSTFAAALVAVGASYLFPTDLTLAAPAEAQGTPSGIGEVLGTLASNMVANPVDALANANYLGILAMGRRAGHRAARGVQGTVKDVFAKRVRRRVHRGALGDRARPVRRAWASCTPPCRRTAWTIFAEYGRLLLGARGLHAVHRPRCEPAHRVLPACARTPTPSCCAA